MRALHLSFYSGEFYLWAEGRATGSANDLDQALLAVFSSTPIPQKPVVQRFIWLPTRGDRPVPSSPLLPGKADGRRKLKLFPHFAELIKLDIEDMALLATGLKKGRIPGSEVIFGASLMWFGKMMELALKLALEERFLPNLVFIKGHHEGRWTVVVGDETTERLNALAAAMPQSYRAVSDSDGEIPSIPRSLLARKTLLYLTDAIVRLAAPKFPFSGKPASVHDAWLASLVSTDAKIVWPNERDLKQLSQQLSVWSRPVDRFEKSPFRFIFRISEPADENEKWLVEYLVQPKDDPSLQVAVSELWDKRSEAAAVLEKIAPLPIEMILTALGQAAALCPPVAQSLKEKAPWGFSLNSVGAYQFLRDYTPLLETSGFTVLVPSWWKTGGSAVRLRVGIKAKSPEMQAAGNLSMGTLLSFEYTASLGDEELTLKELRELAKLKIPLVKRRGQWIAVNPEEVQEMLAFFLKNQGKKSLSARELVQIALGAPSPSAALPVESVEADGWFGELLNMLRGRENIALLQQPESFQGTLRHYQVYGFSWLSFLRKWGFGACLADDMGLGKTIQALALIQKEYSEGEKKPALLICPTSVLNTWRKEAARFTPDLPVFIHHGAGRLKKGAFVKEVKDKALVVTSYSLLPRDGDFIKKVAWSAVMLDEAQNIKNPETLQSKAVRTLPADYRLALTGTPLENHVGELWALMDFLNPGLLGSQSAFKANYFKPIQVFGDTKASEQLRHLTAPFILRRLKSDKSIISDLPEKLEKKEYCTLTKEQASLYQAVVDEMQQQVLEAEGIARSGLVLATLTKLKQVCNHPAQFAKDKGKLKGRSGKLERLLEILAELYETGERALIFTQYAEMGNLLQKAIQDYFAESVFFLHGAIPRKKRDEMIETFQGEKSGGPRHFILSLKAGGTGLTLTKANHVIHYDRWWNPAVENQATDRAYRIGQEQRVQVYKFMVAGTLEERIDEMIERKKNIAGQIIGSGEQWISELSNDEFVNLIRLGQEAEGN
jgi:superfamily II DNA or RNA helicase